MEVSTVRVLVVDDFEPFRRFVCSTLVKRRDLQVIGEALDGLEAVRKAEELKPDLVVLDIGLPTLNGIEVARRIRKLCPECKILFMSQGTSADVAQEAFNLGALGYVVKAHTPEANCQPLWKGFVRAGSLLVRDYRVTTGPMLPMHKLPTTSSPQEVLPPLVPGRAEITHSHEVQFYSDDAAFLLGVTCFIEAAVGSNHSLIPATSGSCGLAPGCATVAQPGWETTNLNPWLGKWAMLWRKDS